MSEPGPEALTGIVDVSRETIDRLSGFVDLIRKWNVAENLVAPHDVSVLWSRHIADCAQLPALIPQARTWVDIGAGAGLPGIVIALVAATGTSVTLVESNQRKCAFLRQAIRATSAPATVLQGRAETVLTAMSASADCVTARGVAPLDRLIALTLPLLSRGAVGLFPKGRGYRQEVDAASHHWQFDLIQHPSRVEADAAILEVRNVREKASATRG